MMPTDFDAMHAQPGGAYAEAMRQLKAAQAEVERLRSLAEDAVFACLPLLPLNGSADMGYKVSGRIDSTLRALPEEWAGAALAIADLHEALNAR